MFYTQEGDKQCLHWYKDLVCLRISKAIITRLSQQQSAPKGSIALTKSITAFGKDSVGASLQVHDDCCSTFDALLDFCVLLPR